MVKNFLFYRDSNRFDDILNDTSIKKYIRTKLLFLNYLIITIYQDSKEIEKTISYIMLKYGEDVKDFTHIIPNRTPIPNVDYMPKRD